MNNMCVFVLQGAVKGAQGWRQIDATNTEEPQDWEGFRIKIGIYYKNVCCVNCNISTHCPFFIKRGK